MFDDPFDLVRRQITVGGEDVFGQDGDVADRDAVQGQAVGRKRVAGEADKRRTGGGRADTFGKISVDRMDGLHDLFNRRAAWADAIDHDFSIDEVDVAGPALGLNRKDAGWADDHVVDAFPAMAARQIMKDMVAAGQEGQHGRHALFAARADKIRGYPAQPLAAGPKKVPGHGEEPDAPDGAGGGPDGETHEKAEQEKCGNDGQENAKDTAFARLFPWLAMNDRCM